ncbi:DUF4760 domain-containing protein [Halopseudomonas sp.]|uniref:DUF4760 domain-containing protein n=1 Tax=Halopseudomonas sp. TaxID=2901191 RepID=UPI00311E1D28
MECEGFFGCFESVVGSTATQNSLLFFAAAVAVVSVLYARATAKKQQSADLLLQSRTDGELVAAMRCISDLHELGDGSIRDLASKTAAETKEAKCVRYVLNHWEYVSVGVQSGIYDEAMLRRASFNTVIQLHKSVRPFIDNLRGITGRNTIYQEFQWLAERWEAKGLSRKKPKS